MRDLLNNYFNEVKHFSEESEILQKLIISLAVQGKLINKKSTSESAKNLLKEIKKEKEFLIKKGEKILFSSFDQKLLIPFKIPTNWEWSTLGEICSYIQRGKSPKYALKGPKVISQKCIQWSGLDLSVAKFIENESLLKYKKEQFLKEGDLLWNSTGTGTIGRVLKVNNLEEKLVCDSHVTILRCLKVNPDFVKIWLMSDFVYGLIEEKAKGSTNQIELTKKIAIQQCVPIPPLKEQNIIVEKVEEIIRLCNQLEKNQNNSIETHNTLITTLLKSLSSKTVNGNEFATTWQTIQENFNMLFTTESSIKKLEQTILQLAVMGKLVSQIPEDEPASELLKKIDEAKAKFINEKKIKKQKPLPKIIKKEEPYSLPHNWEWIRLGDATNYGITKKIEASKVEEEIWVLELEDIEKNTSRLLKKVRFNERRFKSTKNIFNKSDVIYGKLRPYLDKVVIADEPGVCTTEMIPLKGYAGILSEYLRWVMKSPYFIKYANDSTHGMNLPRMGTEKARLALIPLPPKEEQYRIVAKVNKLMTLCDQLKSSLAMAQTTQLKLTDSIVEKAIG